MDKIDLPGKRKVKHLTLLRESRTITPAEFNALSFEERLEMVRVSDSAFRTNLLLEARDGERIMQRLSGQDVYLTLVEAGAEAIDLLLPMISPDQFTFCLDFECWEHDRIDSEKGLSWLEQLLGCEEEKILQVAREMNFELLVLILKKHVTVLNGPDEIDDEDVRIQAMRRDGGYEFAFRNGEETKLFTKLFEILFRLDPGFYSYLIEAVRGEIDAMIEESVYQQRTGRLHDAGFPDPVEAKSVYAWLDPGSFEAGEKKVPMEPGEGVQAQPAYMLIEANPRDLLAAALSASLTPSSNWELACLANKVLIADRVDWSNRAEVQASLKRMYETFNLALEYLCDDKDGAVELLGNAYFQHLFQVGHSLKARLQRSAARLIESEVGPYFDAPYRSFLDALNRKPHPLYFPGLDNPEETEEQPFSSAIGLVKAEKWLERITLQQRLFTERLPFTMPEEATTDLDGCSPASVEDLTLSQLFLTALANRLLGREFAPEPIMADELPGLHATVTRSGRLDPELRDEIVAWIEGLVDGAGYFAGWCLDEWDYGFCTVDPAAIDPRFVSGVIVRRD